MPLDFAVRNAKFSFSSKSISIWENDLRFSENAFGIVTDFTV